MAWQMGHRYVILEVDLTTELNSTILVSKTPWYQWDFEFEASLDHPQETSPSVELNPQFWSNIDLLCFVYTINIFIHIKWIRSMVNCGFGSCGSQSDWWIWLIQCRHPKKRRDWEDERWGKWEEEKRKSLTSSY